MSTQNQKHPLHSFNALDNDHPNEVICAILNISQQSTFAEITHAYELQRAELQNVDAKDGTEVYLLNQKIQTLENAYMRYCSSSLQNDNGAPRPDFQSRPARQPAYTTYSFNIPCIFALVARGADCAMNCVCGCCSGEGCGDPCREGCFYSNYYCDILRFFDTVIAIIALVAGLIWSVRRIMPGIARGQQNRIQHRQDRSRRKLARRFNSEYAPKLNRTYEEWIALQQYDLNIMPFLKEMNRLQTGEAIDADFAQMTMSIENSYRELSNRWQQFDAHKRELMDNRNSDYYQYLCKDAPDRQKYAEMFSTSSVPWEKWM